MKRDHNRPNLRLPDFDYATVGAYFMTICTLERNCLFGAIEDDFVSLNHAGKIVTEEWARSFEIRRRLGKDEFVVMPNHIHGIVWIKDDDEAVGDAANRRLHLQPRDIPQANCRLHLQTYHDPYRSPRKPHSLASFIAQFKAVTTKRINEHRGTPGVRIWQPNFFEHVIRDEEDLYNIRKYIQENPLKWSLDKENPDNL